MLLSRFQLTEHVILCESLNNVYVIKYLPSQKCFAQAL